METERFDQLGRGLGKDPTRRSVLGALLAVALSPGGLEEIQGANAEHRKRGSKNKRRGSGQRGRRARRRGRGGPEAGAKRHGARRTFAATTAAKNFICHRTSSDTNQYGYLEVSMNAVDQHIDHHGDILNVDLMTNNQHCGECGNACPGGGGCANGHCVHCFPSAEGQCPTEGTTVEVPSNAYPGVSTGVVVTPDQPVVVCASGAWNVGAPQIYGTAYDGFGSITNPTEPCALVPCAPMGALIGSLDNGMTWFAVGAGPATIAGSGELRLLANDCPCDPQGGCFSDNEGSIMVTIGSA